MNTRDAVPDSIQPVLLERNDWVPNNPRLPVIVYRDAVATQTDDLPPAWRRFSAPTAGHRNGATGSTTFTTTTPKATKCWVLPVARRA